MSKTMPLFRSSLPPTDQWVPQPPSDEHSQTSTRRHREDSRGGPAHQGVLPALPGVKVDLPLLGAVGPGLHGRLGGHEDAHLARLDVLFGNARQTGDILRANRKKNKL